MEIFLIITQLLFALAIAYFSYWFPSYIKKKAENAAQKEDLKDLTKIVKEVEQKFTAETEQLKAQLSLINQLQANLYNDEKEALINVYSSLLEMLYLLLDLKMSHSGQEQIIEIGDKRNLGYTKIVTSIMRLNLFSMSPLNTEATILRDEMHNLNQELFKISGEYIANHQEHQPENMWEMFNDDISRKHTRYVTEFAKAIIPKLDTFSHNIREHLKEQYKM